MFHESDVTVRHVLSILGCTDDSVNASSIPTKSFRDKVLNILLSMPFTSGYFGMCILQEIMAGFRTENTEISYRLYGCSGKK